MDDRQRMAAWAGSGIVLYVVGGVLSLLVVAFTTQLLGSVGLYEGFHLRTVSVENATWMVAWGLVVAAPAGRLARRLVPAARFGLDAWLVLAVGLALAAASEYLIAEFVRHWAGNFDPEYAGIGGLAPYALVAVSLGAWAAFAVRRSARGVLAALELAAVAGLAAAIATNVPGALDGIQASNRVLAMTLVLDAAYAVVVLLLILVVPDREPDPQPPA